MDQNSEMYFMFSRNQLEFQKKMYEKIAKDYPNKYVMYNGNRLQYTQVVADPTSCKYADAQIIAHGLLTQMKYDK